MRSAVVLVALLLAACMPSPPLTPSDKLLGLRVLFNEPVRLTWNDSGCDAVAAAIEAEVRDRIRAALSRVGFEVVSQTESEHDTVARASLVIDHCWEWGNLGTLTIELEPGATVAGTYTNGPRGAKWNKSYRIARDWETQIFKRLQGAPQLHALKTRPRATASKPTEPTPAETPTPSAPEFLIGAPQADSFALVIGIERYRDVPGATGARADAETFARLARTTLGVPGDNLRLLLDERAGRADIETALEWLKGNAPANARIILYYSGHGAPEAAKGTPYLVPYDGDPRSLRTTALALTDVLMKLSETQAAEILAITDACFAGAGGRSVLPPGTRPLVRVKDAPAAPRVAVFAAAGGAEISGSTLAGGGLFTRVLVEALGTGLADIDGDGNISLHEAREWVGPRVTREAKRDHRDQTPNVALGPGVREEGFFLVRGLTRAQ